jgi:hypothetical protein
VGAAIFPLSVYIASMTETCPLLGFKLSRAFSGHRKVDLPRIRYVAVICVFRVCHFCEECELIPRHRPLGSCKSGSLENVAFIELSSGLGNGGRNSCSRKQ